MRARTVSEWIEEKILTQRNIERFVKYYWVVSTLRLVLGFVLMYLILIAGYSFTDLLPKL
jgi:hypothetical protein